MDPSSRYILPADAPYLANLAALWAVDPALAAGVEATHGRASYPVHPSKAGHPTVAVPAPKGNAVHLHSRYEPVEEAKRLIEPVNFAETVAFYVHGFGLGYHLEALFNRASDEALFCVFEPDLLLLRTAFEQRDFSRLIDSRRVMFFTKPDKADLFTRLTPHTAFLSVGLATVTLPPSLQVAGEFHRQMQTWVGEYAAFARTSMNTLVLNSRKTAENIARNLGWYAGTPSAARLANRHQGKPAIIVSAGPSLRKNKHLLKEVAGWWGCRVVGSGEANAAPSPSPPYSGERAGVRGFRAEGIGEKSTEVRAEAACPNHATSTANAETAKPLTPALSPEYGGEGEEGADRAIIIAVQTTLKPLLEMGIEPHYVTSLDYHDICTRFFEGLPPTLRTELVAEPKATSAVFSMFPGPVTLIGNDFADQLLGGKGPEKGKLPSGATVAHLAFYLAEHLGCDPIIFVGQDLGFSDGLCYAPGTSYEDVWRPELSRFCTVEMKQWEQIVRERFILRRIPDHAGRPMYTEERLFTYLQQFERDFARSKARVIDATEGGAAKRGATPMTLAEAIERFCVPSPSPPPAASAVEPYSGERAGVRGHRAADAVGQATESRAEPASVLHIPLAPDTGRAKPLTPTLSPEYGSTALAAGGGEGDGAAPRWDRLPLCIAALGQRRAEAAEVERIGRETLPLLEEVRDHLGDQRRVNAAIGRIDVLRARMNGLGACYDLITQLTQKTELARFEADRRLSASKLGGRERQRRQITRDIENVKGVADAAAEFQKLMDEAIENLMGEAERRCIAIDLTTDTQREAA